MKSPLFYSRRMTTLLIVASVASFGYADSLLTPAEKKEAVKQIAQVYERRYVYPHLGKQMADLIRKKVSAGQYDSLNEGREFAGQITRDLRSVIRDYHLAVAYTPERILKRKNTPPDILAREEMRNARRNNHGFKEAKVLDGNVGYLRLTSFEGSKEAYTTAANALQFLRHCEALILDLRFNPGGDSGMVQFLASYFLKEGPVLLDVFHHRQGNRTAQLWSLPDVPGDSLAGMDLYILIDRYTFSCAEGLAYDLQALKRATIIGSPSAGGAHAVETEILLDSFICYIPVAYSQNPVTQSNFQGRGVTPDIPLENETALSEAHVLALEKQVQKESDPHDQEELIKLIQQMKSDLKARDKKRA